MLSRHHILKNHSEASKFVAIVYPIKAHILCGRRKIVFAILLVWPIAIGCGMPTAIFNTVLPLNPGAGAEYCMIVFPHIRFLILFQYMQFVLFYFVPVFIQIILYTVIGRKLYASTNELHTRFQMRPDFKCHMDRSMDTIKARKNVVKMLVASVLVYSICYAPPQILLFYNTLSPRMFEVTWSWHVFSYVISYINSAANPVLYCIFSQNFRRNFKKYLCFICRKKPQTYQKVVFESFESRVISRKISSSPTTVSRL
ncbi:hypothetical protein ACJMK2_044097 [Sinanodonta woodiana]|uniref:G-protein coupled receptors family 1 profile domain-containing protein n=1 Tax=Sinanodonta woodiana TaxID=1069815 RepID=A0ABD3VZI9_SINWO